MTNEEIIEEAKKRYPIGTKVISLGGSGINTIRHHDFFFPTGYDDFLRVTDDCSIYNKGTWAKIIEKPNNLKLYKIL